MAESRGGRGSTACSGSESLRPADKPSPHGQTFHFFGQECPWNRSPGRLWFTRMPTPRGGGGGTFNGLAVSWVWTGPQMHWHINCLELLAEHLALNHLKRHLRGEHLHCDRCVHQPTRWSTLPSQLARHLLLWSQKHLRSLRDLGTCL